MSKKKKKKEKEQSSCLMPAWKVIRLGTCFPSFNLSASVHQTHNVTRGCRCGLVPCLEIGLLLLYGTVVLRLLILQ
jgi:hypothetical protein